jgi:hypothetical protein
MTNPAATTLTDNTYKLTLAEPPHFDGDKKNYKAFIKSLQLHFATKPDIFNNQTKVIFTLGYMTKVFAYDWAEAKQEEFIESNNFGKWEDFKKELDASFKNQDEKSEAQIRLERYTHDKGVSAEEFFLHFEQLWKRVGFKKKEHEGYLISQIERAVWDQIIDAIYYSNSELPKDYDSWKDQVIKIDNLRR